MVTRPGQLDGEQFFHWAQAAAVQLQQRRSEINALNVFPVPDSDTGSNMARTMAAAVEAASQLTPTERGDVTTVVRALADGAIRGARGNSGLVLSQVLRGLADGSSEHTGTPDGDGFDGKALARCLRIAVRLVDAAITDPVEGTVVTVLRATTVAAEVTAETTADLAAVATTAYEAAHEALLHTPSQLAVLRDAGVVDAGAAGFVIFLHTLVDQLQSDAPTPIPATPNTNEDPGPQGGQLEVMFWFEAPDATIDRLKTELAPLGDSLVISRTDNAATVHIHSPQAGTVIETAMNLGAISHLRLEILPDQPALTRPGRVLVALTPPGALATLYRTVGAEVVEIDHQAHPPADVVSAILTTVRTVGAEEVILLPNGLLNRRQLAAVDTATHALSQTITLVPTRRVVAGIAAIALHEADAPLATAAYAMSQAAADMRTATVRHTGTTYDVHAYDDAHHICTCDTLIDAILAGARELLATGGEQVTVLVPPGIDHTTLSHQLNIDVMAFDSAGLESTGLIAEIGVE